MGKQRTYDKEYKIQAVKLAHEIGSKCQLILTISPLKAAFFFDTVR